MQKLKYIISILKIVKPKLTVKATNHSGWLVLVLPDYSKYFFILIINCVQIFSVVAKSSSLTSITDCEIDSLRNNATYFIKHC